MLYLVQCALSFSSTSPYPDVLYFCPSIKRRQTIKTVTSHFSRPLHGDRDGQGSCFDQLKTDVQKAINVGSLISLFLRESGSLH